MKPITGYINKRILLYLAKFLGAFCILFYGTEAIIGLSAPEGLYVPFVAKYLDFIPAFRNLTLQGSRIFLSLTGYEAYQSDPIHLKLIGGSTVQLVYSCLGYGVMSFWLAFVFANNGSLAKKAAWMGGGLVLLFLINIIRIALTLLGNSRHWYWPFGWDNHTWFNIVAYAAIFLMMWGYDRRAKS